MYFVYALTNTKTGTIYIGQTTDLQKRLQRHNGYLPVKLSSFTVRGKGFWKYVFIEKHGTRAEAVKREKQLKSSRGRSFIKNLIKTKKIGLETWVGSSAG